MWVNHSGNIQLSKIEDKSKPGLYAIALTYTRDGKYEQRHTSTQWRFLKDHQGYLMINDKPVSLGDGIHNGDVIRTPNDVYVIENITYILKSEVISSLGVANKIEGRVGYSEFALSPTQLNGVKHFIDTVVYRHISVDPPK